MKTLKWISCCLLLVLAGGVTESADLDKDGYLDYYAMLNHFAETLGKRHEKGELVTLETLNKQLEKERRYAFTPRKEPSRWMSQQSVYRESLNGVVLVGKIHKCDKCEDWHSSVATGFVIGKDGLIITNYHVVEKDEEGVAIGVMTFDGRLLPIREVLASNQHVDLALLKVDATDLSPLPIAEQVEIGEEITVISHPVRHLYNYSEGIVAGKYRHEHHGKEIRQVAITADYAKGSSGAPVLNAAGAVVGIARTTEPVYYKRVKGANTALQMVWKFCIPSGDLLDLLSKE